MILAVMAVFYFQFMCSKIWMVMVTSSFSAFNLMWASFIPERSVKHRDSSQIGCNHRMSAQLMPLDMLIGIFPPGMVAPLSPYELAFPDSTRRTMWRQGLRPYRYRRSVVRGNAVTGMLHIGHRIPSISECRNATCPFMECCMTK